MDQPLKRKDYKHYIKSHDWEEVKSRFRLSNLYRDGHCFVCTNAGIEIHIHHLTYKRLGIERLRDLRILCAVCHAAAHTRKPRKMRAKFYPYASRNCLCSLRKTPRLFAYHVATFWGVLNHPFVTRLRLTEGTAETA